MWTKVISGDLSKIIIVGVLFSESSKKFLLSQEKSSKILLLNLSAELW